jgi:type IV pilus assembly protein PilP
MLYKNRLLPRHYLGILACSLVLAGCSHRSTTADLSEYAQELQAHSKPNVAPLPTMGSYQPVVFTSDNLRSPFALNGLSSEPVGRVKDPLEYFPMDSLQYVGMIEADSDIWALVKAPDGQVYKIVKGNYIGQNGGQVVSITERQLLVNQPATTQSNGKPSQVILELKY